MKIQNDGTVTNQNGKKVGKIKPSEVLKAVAVAGSTIVLITTSAIAYHLVTKYNKFLTADDLQSMNNGTYAMTESSEEINIDPIIKILEENNGFFYGYVNDVKNDVTAKYEGGVLDITEEEFNFILDEVDLFADSIFNSALNGDYKTASLGLEALVKFAGTYSTVVFSAEEYRYFTLSEEEAYNKDILNTYYR